MTDEMFFNIAFISFAINIVLFFRWLTNAKKTELQQENEQLLKENNKLITENKTLKTKVFNQNLTVITKRVDKKQLSKMLNSMYNNIIDFSVDVNEPFIYISDTRTSSTYRTISK